MSSTTTIFMRQPLNYARSLVNAKNDYSYLLSIFLWTVAGMYSASRTTFNHSITGLTITFPVLDLVLILMVSVCLYIGFAQKRILMTIPWIILSVSSIYFNHYVGLVSVLTNLRQVRKLSWLPWASLVLSIVLLIIRLTLTIRIFQLCINIWFKKKLRELKSIEKEKQKSI